MCDLYWKLVDHIGHKIVCVAYGEDTDNVSVECEDCDVVLVDADRPEYH